MTRVRTAAVMSVLRGALLLLIAQFGFAAQIPNVDYGALVSGSGLPIGTSPAPSVPAARPDTVDAASLLNPDAGLPGDQLKMFGQQLFIGQGGQSHGTGFNPDYTLSIGDRVVVRLWGAFAYEQVQLIDPQGNIFIPNVGPVRVVGVRNSDLNEVVSSAVSRVYRENVGVYASLDASQPVRIFVTGYVRAPGQYAGVASESILGYLTRAGGVDPERGSYIDIRLLRGKQERMRLNLYDFILEGTLEGAQLQDGDTVVVNARGSAVKVTGEVLNPYGFEFPGEEVSALRLLQLARSKPEATHVSIVRRTGLKQTAEYHAIDELYGVMLRSGDEMSVVADRTVGTILVRVDGAVDSSRVLTLPYGTRLGDALAMIIPTPQANPDAVQLYRVSVAERQREMLELSLHSLESYALTTRSSTSEESTLRAQEAQMLMRFIESARNTPMRGQVILAGRETAMETLLEDSDVLYIPERSSIVMVHGEVTQPNAIAYDSRSTVRDYLSLAGGTTQKRSDSRVLLLRQNGTFEENDRARPGPGDEIIVLPQVKSKNVEVTRGITQILYQLAIAARVVIDI